jgi:hypothetical protein
MEGQSSGFGRPNARARLLVALNVTALLAVLLGIPVTSGATAVISAHIAASPTSAGAGDPTTVRGAGFSKNQRGYLALDGATGKTSFRAAADGSFTVSFKVPAGASAGWHTLDARASKGTALATTTIEVLSASSTASPAPTAAPTATPSSVPTATPSPSPTPVATPSPTPSASPAVTPSPTPSASPAVTPTPSPSASPTLRSDAFVSACGTALCLAGQRWYLYGASDLGGLDNPDARAALAVSGQLNTLRIVNFLDEHGSVASAPYNAAYWSRVDAAIGSARAAGLRVILDLSTYRNLLWNSGRNPYTWDWGPFVAFVAQRVNTATGVRYADDPTIALIAFAGEIEPLNTPANTLGITTTQVTAFFDRTFGEWRAQDSRHLLSTGGLLQLAWDSGIDWRSIFALENDDVCSIHDYSKADQTMTTPAVASYCASIGKPWITEEFGWDQAVGDATRAADFSAMYGLQLRYAAAGVGFWNLGSTVAGTGGVTDTYDVNPSTPLAWSVVGSNAP